MNQVNSEERISRMTIISIGETEHTLGAMDRTILSDMNGVSDLIALLIEGRYRVELIGIDDLREHIDTFLVKTSQGLSTDNDFFLIKKSIIVHILEGKGSTGEIGYALSHIPDSSLALLSHCDQRNRFSDEKVKMHPRTDCLLDQFYKMRCEINKLLPSRRFCKLVDTILEPYK